MGGVEISRERAADFERANWQQQVGGLTAMIGQLQAANEALGKQVEEGTERLNKVTGDLHQSHGERDDLVGQLHIQGVQLREAEARIADQAEALLATDADEDETAPALEADDQPLTPTENARKTSG